MQDKTPLRLSQRSIIGFVLTTVITAGLLLLLFVRLLNASHAAASNAATTLIVGHQAPDFTIQTWNGAPGQKVHLADLKGKPVVVNFFASWCGPCQEEAPVFAKAYQQYAPQGVVFVGVAFEDKQADATSFLTQYGVKYAAGPDPDGAIAVSYAVTGVPETVFIDRTGRITYKWGGALDEATAKTQIEALLK